MSNVEKIRPTSALVIPGDNLFSDVSLKRLLLFFDSVSLIHSCDNALIHTGEVSERFVQNGKSGVLGIGERVPFPRVQDYDESFSGLIAKTVSLQKINLLKVMPRLKLGLYNDEKGFESTFRIPELKDEWSILSHFRMARAIKALLYAHLFNCCPIALDEANANILTTFFTPPEFFAPDNLKPSREQMIDFSIAMDVVDPSDLEEKLKDMSFEDVIHCREQILPHVSKARDYILHNYGETLKGTNGQFQHVRHKIQTLKKQFVQYQEEMAETWESLKIGTKISIGATIVSDLLFYPPFHNWHTWALNCVKSLGETTLPLYPSIRKYLTTKNNVRKHPLRFVYQAVSKIHK